MLSNMLFRRLISIVLFALITQSGSSQGLRGFGFTGNAGYLSVPDLNSALSRVDSEQSGANGGFFM